jgi:hypothetical protein
MVTMCKHRQKQFHASIIRAFNRAFDVLLSLALGLAAVPASAQAYPPPGPGINLLTNPGHEHPGVYFAGRGEINVTWNWVPFWEEPPAGIDLRDVNYRTPEFRPTFAHEYPERVHSGGGSDHWFNFYALNRRAGIMQYVVNLPVGSRIRFTSWLQVWSTNDNLPMPDKANTNEGNLNVRVCIGQNGGVMNVQDPNLVCSAWAQPNNRWEQLSVDGVALNSAVYVMIWSTAEYAVQHNDIYADDSCFEVLPAAGAQGVCSGAGFVPTGPNLMPAGPDAPNIRSNTPAPPAQRPAQSSASGRGRITAPAGDEPALAITARASAILWPQPRRAGKAVDYAPRGAVLPVTGRTQNGQWYQVNFNGAQAWVPAYLALPNAAARNAQVIR